MNMYRSRCENSCWGNTAATHAAQLLLFLGWPSCLALYSCEYLAFVSLIWLTAFGSPWSRVSPADVNALSLQVFTTKMVRYQPRQSWHSWLNRHSVMLDCNTQVYATRVRGNMLGFIAPGKVPGPFLFQVESFFSRFEVCLWKLPGIIHPGGWWFFRNRCPQNRRIRKSNHQNSQNSDAWKACYYIPSRSISTNQLCRLST